ncbi:hypothetical protein C817_01591 [Dorea sp. 5-2]|nr:hypothetical protein C817_01591 [Dorea sp. 5-2]
MKMKKMVALITAGVLCLGMSMTAFAADLEDGSPNKPPKPTEPTTPTTPTQPAKPNEGFNGFLSINGGKDVDIKVPAYLADDLVAGDLETAKNELTDKQYENVVNTLTDPKAIEDIIKDACNVPSDIDCEVLVVGNIQYTGDKFPAGGIDMSVNIGSASANGLKNGDSIYVLHYNKTTGKWEVLQGTVKLNGDSAYVDVHFDSLSPVAFIKVTSNGKVVPYDAKGNPVTPVKTKSPKTGEF